MKLDIEVNISSQCGLYIQDKTVYAPEQYVQPTNKNIFLKKSEAQSITLLYLNPYSEKSQYQGSFSSSEIPINFDGYFTLYYIVLPTKEWVYKNQIIVNLFSNIYYINNGQIYKYNSGESDEIIQNQNLLNIVESPNIDSNISSISKDYVSICFLQKCYVNLCQQIFKENISSQCNNIIDKNLSYNRDLVWMAINVIKYLVEDNQLYEAQRIIELLHSCNGVCKNTLKKIKHGGCNCS